MADQHIMQGTTPATPFLLWAQWATVNRWRQHSHGGEPLSFGASIGRIIGAAGNELKELGQFSAPARSFREQLRRLGKLPT